MSDFKWSGDDADSIVLGWQPRTAVYETTEGGVMIRQECDPYEERDDQILLTPMGALQVAWRMIEVAHAIGLPQPSRDLMKKLDLGPASPPLPLPGARQPIPEPDLLAQLHQETAE